MDIQKLADELVDQIAADPEVRTVNVSCMMRPDYEFSMFDRRYYNQDYEAMHYYDDMESHDIERLCNGIPERYTGMRRHDECCIIVNEKTLNRIKLMRTGTMVKTVETERDCFNNPTMYVGIYRICHTLSDGVKLRPSISSYDYSNYYRDEPITVALFVNLPEYKKGNKDAAVKLVYPKRVRPPKSDAQIALEAQREQIKAAEGRVKAVEKPVEKESGGLNKYVKDKLRQMGALYE